MQYLLYENKPDVQEILQHCSASEHVFLKFLSANDLQLTGSHQSGIYMCKECWPIFLDEPGADGENREVDIKIQWPEGYHTESKFIWYGRTKREYRLTRVMSYFRGHEERYLGSLLVISRREGTFRAWAVDDDDDLNMILNFFGISPTETNRLIRFDWEDRLTPFFEKYTSILEVGFPDTEKLAQFARRIFEDLYGMGEPSSADRAIIELIRIEYSFFRYLERIEYRDYLKEPFRSIEDLLSVSLEINNRRKSRAGRSLENQLKYIFDLYRVPFSHGAVTNEEKRPDFIFPGITEYNDPEFPAERLFFLGAKTTCKDRWRQVINEADRIPVKYLFTLQQGFSSAQLREMHLAGVVPVMPADYHEYCKKQDRERLLSLDGFIRMVLDANGAQPGLF